MDMLGRCILSKKYYIGDLTVCPYKEGFLFHLKECELLLELAEVELCIGPISAAVKLAKDLLIKNETHCVGELNNEGLVYVFKKKF